MDYEFCSGSLDRFSRSSLQSRPRGDLGLTLTKNKGASCSFKFFLGRCTRLVHLDSELLSNGTASKKLNSVIATMNKSKRTKCCLVNLGTGFKALLECVEVHHSINGLEIKIIETTLGKATDQRHLTALESKTDATAGTCFLTLVASTRSLTVAAAFADTKALLAMLGTRARNEIVKSHGCHTSNRWIGLGLRLLLQLRVPECGFSFHAAS